MLRLFSTMILAGIAVSACVPKQMTLGEAMDYCQEKADAAAGPQGNVTIGIGTDGPTFGAGISISDSYLRGDDPTVVYNKCMSDLSANNQIIGGA